MGDGAEAMLQYHMTNMWANDKPSYGDQRRRVLVKCSDCGKPCRGKGGVMAHQKAKHGASYKGYEILRMLDGDERETPA